MWRLCRCVWEDWASEVAQRASLAAARDVMLGGVDKQRWQQGDKCFNARWVDEQHKEKSRYMVKGFANMRDPTIVCMQQPAIQQWEEWLSSRWYFKTAPCSRLM